MGKKEIKDILLKNLRIAEKYKIKSLFLFGSCVREEATEESDVDLLIEFKEPTFRNYVGCLREYQDLFGQKVDLVCRDSLKQRIRSFVLAEAEQVL
ncbi:MAG: nucleotidyltransferase domain-containing protein [Candidatus Omnitrophica bacterium]|nr:nucleotidyltransferase domain-containing protein [Candidatus Omnitrophota bacterium]